MHSYQTVARSISIALLLAGLLVGCEDSPVDASPPSKAEGDLVVVADVLGDLQENIPVRWDNLGTEGPDFNATTLLRNVRFVLFEDVPATDIEVFLGEDAPPEGCIIDPASQTLQVREGVRHAVIFRVACDE